MRPQGISECHRIRALSTLLAVVNLPKQFKSFCLLGIYLALAKLIFIAENSHCSCSTGFL